MRKDLWNTKELTGKSTYWIGRKFKPIWRLSETDYNAARDQVFELVNVIRRSLEVPEYTLKKFNDGMSYRTVFGANYLQSRIEFVNLVFGWW
jgi:hypothetical protein